MTATKKLVFFEFQRQHQVWQEAVLYFELAAQPTASI
jgi:hypothetical protein